MKTTTHSRAMLRCRICGATLSVDLTDGVWERRHYGRLPSEFYYRDATGRTVERLPWEGVLRNPDQTFTRRCECGCWMKGRAVEGVLRPGVPCDRRCTGAKGHQCECECGGANHGADHR